LGSKGLKEASLSLGKFTIVIHGGAGLIRPDRYTQAELGQYEIALESCVDAGYGALDSGASALEAVTLAVRMLEDCPQFNAGRGSVLNAEGKVQMDASIMCGATKKCGAVTLIENVKNPILAAKMVMDRTPHRMLGGADAETLARFYGLEFADPSYFILPLRQEQLQRARESHRIELDHSSIKKSCQDSNTVGAVAFDKAGNLASATSTGGLTNKLPGRVSDSSIIGAGTFADNSTLAISGTGMGEFFIQNVLAFDVHAKMKYAGFSLREAVQRGLEELNLAGGEGGVIALNRAGEINITFTTEGMFRAWRNVREKKVLCFS